MVRLGKLESAHPCIKAFHIDFITGRASTEEAKVASAEGIFQSLPKSSLLVKIGYFCSFLVLLSLHFMVLLYLHTPGMVSLVPISSFGFRNPTIPDFLLCVILLHEDRHTERTSFHKLHSLPICPASCVEESSSGRKEVASLYEQLNAARKLLEDAEAAQSAEGSNPEGSDKAEKKGSDTIATLRDKRRRLTIKLKEAKEKVLLPVRL